ncbi:class I SAM-dependent methyltransferase [Sporosarcina sp. CAU 1771]
MKTIISTGGRPGQISQLFAEQAADVLGYSIVERKKRSIARLQNDYDAACLIAGKSRYELYRKGMEKPFFFHPNSAAFRIKRLVTGEEDPLIQAAQLQEGMSFLDCTLGLASDSIIASSVVGSKGCVTGLEMDPDVAFITKVGLRSFPSESAELVEAMKRVQVVQIDSIEFLKAQADSSWDIVYIDPMFSAPIEESSNFTPLRQVGAQASLTLEWMQQAYRVSKERVVIKDRFDSPVFEHYGANRFVRPNTKFHFGTIEKRESHHFLN